jgi:hypothetical protein
MLKLNWFDAYLIIVGLHWYISLPAGLLLAGFALFGKSQHWAGRSLEGLLAITLLFPVLWYASNVIQQKQQRQQRQANREAHAWVLDKPTTVAGIDLPADTKIHLNTSFDMKQKEQAQIDDIDDMNLAAPATIFGIKFTGYLNHAASEWEGTMQGHQMIDGWPCRGEITLYEKRDYNGKEMTRELQLEKCTLYQSHTVFGHTLPKGTKIELQSWNWTFHFPDGHYIFIDPDSGNITNSSDDY